MLLFTIGGAITHLSKVLYCKYTPEYGALLQLHTRARCFIANTHPGTVLYCKIACKVKLCRWVHDAGEGQKSKCATIFWCQTRVPPLPLSSFQSIWATSTAWLKGCSQGAITGIPNFTVTHMLFSDYLFLTSYADHNKLQTMLNKLRAYSQKNLMAVNTQTSKVMCFNSRFGSCLLPFFWGGTQLP